jgi:hypothetical protein
MNNSIRNAFEQQRGQAILLVVILLGFTALAIDGGILYFEQRQAQNAADAALLAATYEMCSNEADAATIQAAGLAAALENGYDNDGAEDIVIIHNPPDVSDPVDAALQTTDYVYVQVWKDVPTFLIHIVYSGPTEVTTRAIGHCTPAQVAFSNYALVAISQDPTKTGLFVGGGGSITINGATAHSNSTNTTNGSAVVAGTGASLIASEPVTASGDIEVNGGSTLIPGGEYADPKPDPLAGLPEPPNPGGCQSVPTIHSGDVVSLTPGCYTGIQMNGGVLNLVGPGIFYFTGDVNITAGDLFAPNVMVFMKDGGFQVTGGTILLTAMTAAPSLAEDLEPWIGMVIYSVDHDESDSIKLTATSHLTLVGTIYAPYTDVELSGQTGDSVTGQIIADTVHVSGQGDFVINYNEAYFFHLPPVIEVVE